MSWIEQITTDFIITCGDGKQYRPAWLNAYKAKEYNVAEFTFPEIEGSLVKRGRAKGRKYNLELYFQGENHLDASNDFEVSADDPRPWVVIHPFYGRITVQPLSITFDNSRYNTTQIRADVIETITEDNPKGTTNPVDQVLSYKEGLDETAIASLNDDIELNTANSNVIAVNNELIYNEARKSIDIDIDFQEYSNLFNEAQSKLLDTSSDPLSTLRSVQALINKPGQFSTAVQNRIESIVNQLSLLKNSLGIDSTRDQKKIYECNASGLVSSMISTSVTDAEYPDRTAIIDTIEIILSSYDNYLSTLDSVQTDDNGTIDSFIPDPDIQIQLNSLVILGVITLFGFIAESRQERRIFIEQDSNIIILIHRFYGLDIEDERINEFIRVNNITLNEYLQIKKGREIIYFV